MILRIALLFFLFKKGEKNMKKILSIMVLTCMVLATSVTAFASEGCNLPYTEGKGYEVRMLEEKQNNSTIKNYDSGWKAFLGGKWRHGVGTRYVWSKFDHDTKVHTTTVQGAGGKYSYSGKTDPGVRAMASWEKALSGNGAWADVK